MEVDKFLAQRLKDNGHGPFLFLGSGFSRRYIGLDSWEGLLRRFCKGIREYEYYLSSANSSLPHTASKMAEDYKEHWWKSDVTAEERAKFKNEVKYVSSPLKISIAEYFRRIFLGKLDTTHPHYHELTELRKANIDGVISTNWDLLTESLFPDYKVYVGQSELLVSTPQNIGEIYKIHGCCTKPNSLILTAEDYQSFEETNPYLAAKLVTIFVENPIIFIGYSLHDPNIRALLSSVIRGVGSDNITKITSNLIFVQRAKDDRSYGVSPTVYSLGNSEIPVTLLITSDYTEIYRPLQAVVRKIPVRVLRHCKEQLYKLVLETSPSSQLSVVNFQDLDKGADVEFVIGVGVQERLAARGYKQIALEDIFRDIILDDGKFDPKALLEFTIPNYCRYSKFVPVFKYLWTLGISSAEEYRQAGWSIRCVEDFRLDNFHSKQSEGCFQRECKGMNVHDIVSKYKYEKAASLVPFIPWDRVDLKALKEFIQKRIVDFNEKRLVRPTYYRKLVCMYDAIAYGRWAM